MCDGEGCKSVQCAACSMQNDSRAQYWPCDDCWLLADERPPQAGIGMAEESDAHGGHAQSSGGVSPISAGRTLGTEASRGAVACKKRVGPASREGWVVGARVINACGVESIIRFMGNGYIQCGRPDCSEISNYRRKELQLIEELSSGDDDQSSECLRQGIRGSCQ